MQRNGDVLRIPFSGNDALLSDRTAARKNRSFWKAVIQKLRSLSRSWEDLSAAAYLAEEGKIEYVQDIMESGRSVKDGPRDTGKSSI